MKIIIAGIFYRLITVSIVMVILVFPGINQAAVLTPCTVIGYANANTYIQAPSYSQQIAFESAVTFSSCSTVTTATIIVANPPQNPPPTAPVYMNLYGAADSTQLLLMQGTTVIPKSDFPSWFPATATSVTGVTITCPSTPWVPSTITIIWQ